MEFYPTLITIHVSSAVLLLLLSILSILQAIMTAVKPGADKANARLVKLGNAIGLIENIVAAIVTLTGLIAVYMGSWPLSALWVWMSLLIMVFYSTTAVAITKPARQAVAVGSSAIKVGMQVLLHVGYFLLLLVGFVLAWFKPV